MRLGYFEPGQIVTVHLKGGDLEIEVDEEWRVTMTGPAVKVYEAETGPGEGVLTLEAEEMAELTVNGVFAGVSFWGPHRFDLTGLLTAGQNKLRLTVTGSRANLYGKPVPYGLK